MKSKKYSCLYICLLFLLTGCVKGNINIEFKDENIASMNLELLIPESLLNNYDTSINDLKNKLEENGLKKWQSEKLNESINGVKYQGFRLKAPESVNKDLMSFFYIDKNKQNYQVKIDLNIVNDLYNTSELKDIDNYSLTNLKNMGLELDLNIIMPGMIKETSFGKIKDNSVKINLLDLLTQDKVSNINIISTIEHKSTFPINFLIIAMLVIILYLILRKSK